MKEVIHMPPGAVMGSEMKPSYYRQACKNLGRALSASAGLFAGTDDEMDDDQFSDSAAVQG